jgi:hypothetical protein
VIANTTLGEGRDEVVWNLEQSGIYSVSSMYAKLSQGATVTHFKDVWAAKIPLKIRIFSWQLILDRLPSSANLARIHGLGSGRCVVCGSEEDVDHIFFACSPALLAWSVLQELLGCSWCPASFAQFFAIVSKFSGSFRRLAWIFFVAQSWALWLCRNKLTIKTMLFLQLWMPPARPKDLPHLRRAASGLKGLHAMLIAPEQ